LKSKQNEIDQEIKRLTKDMKEYEKDKDGKTKEIRVSESVLDDEVVLKYLKQTRIAKQKKDLQAATVTLKTHNLTLQEAKIKKGMPYRGCKSFSQHRL
jgi:hypothetical protein